MSDTIGILEIQAETEAPIWFLNHYLELTSSNYLKIVTLREICRRFFDGATDSDFAIAASSFELYSSQENPFYDRNQIVVLESKSRSAVEFWRLFKYLHRPIVIFRGEPIFDLSSELALKIPKLTLNSPVGISLQGSADGLADLARGKTIAVRENDDIAQSVANVQAIVQTSHLIEDPRTPEGVRRFARDQLSALMNKQDDINRKLGIRHVHLTRRRG